MTKSGWVLAAVLVSGCGGTDDAAKFVGSWAYNAGSAGTVTCGPQSFPFPLDTVVETFVETDGLLVKTDSQGCAGIKFSVVGSVASLATAGQSCAIPAAGMSPAATFAPSAYTYTMSSDGKTLTATLTASYTPSGGTACAATATNTLTKK